MAGAYILGWAIGHGFIFLIVVLFLLYKMITTVVMDLAYRYADYRLRHPPKPRSIHHTRNFMIGYFTFISLVFIYNYLDHTVFHWSH